MRVPTRRAQLLKPHTDDSRFYITAGALERLQHELQDLEKRQHPQAVEEVSRTKELGDFSENAEYQEAKYRLRRILSRIDTLKARIKHAVIIEEQTDSTGQIQIGSTVIVETQGQTKTYQIVGPHETNPARGRISHLSPLGSTLLGHTIGDHISIKTPSGVTVYQITHIS